MSLVRTERRGDVALLTLDRPRANAFSPELVADLSCAFSDAADAGAVVLGSAMETIFSAGWDLKFLATLNRPSFAAFVEGYTDLVRKIFVFERPVIAALPGHAIAGGLIVAAAADERIAAEGGGEFGLPEVVMGVPVPAALLEVFRHALGPRQMERLAASGDNLATDRALAVGLLDRVVPAASLAAEAESRAAFLAGRSRNAHAAIKLRSRSAALARFDQARRGDPFVDFWFSEDARARVGALTARISKKS
jgi:enoyl-CoA hydratase/carnithine racemase